METASLKSNDQELIPKCWVAKSHVSRFLGLMGKKGISKEEAVLFPRCNSIHTFFMRFPIDVVFVTSEGDVVEVIESMGAWRMLFPRFKAKHVIEMKAGRSKELGIRVGSRLNCNGAWD